MPFHRSGPSASKPRLKSPPADTLRDVGFPSKGDHRLLDHSVQYDYYVQIVERYMQFCAGAGTSEQLELHFSALTLSGLPEVNQNKPTRPESGAGRATRHSPDELPLLLTAMRKLREGIVASARTDVFALQVYIFVIRASILARHVDSYHPALLHLLRVLYPANRDQMDMPERRECLAYWLLDCVCRREDYQGGYSVAYVLETECGVSSAGQVARSRTGALGVLHALVHDDYHLFFKLRHTLDGYQRRLVEAAEPRVRRHALKCLGMSYFTASQGFVCAAAGVQRWEELKRDGVGWEVSGETVTIRRRGGQHRDAA